MGHDFDDDGGGMVSQSRFQKILNPVMSADVRPAEMPDDENRVYFKADGDILVVFDGWPTPRVYPNPDEAADDVYEVSYLHKKPARGHRSYFSELSNFSTDDIDKGRVGFWDIGSEDRIADFNASSEQFFAHLEQLESGQTEPSSTVF